MRTLLITWLAIAGIFWSFNADSAPKKRDTIASLDGKEIDVRPSEPQSNNSELARTNYRIFLDLVSSESDLSAEAMRRLADIELESSEVDELAENIDELGGAGYDNAINLYTQLLTRYPDYSRNDMVLYQLARAHENNRNPDKAMEVLDQVVAEYPQTNLMDEVQFRRGETLFINKRYGDAEDAYKAITDFGPESVYFEQSLYKLGWARFKQSFHEESLVPFFGLLDRRLPAQSESVPVDLLEGMSRPERELVEDTFRVLSISFSYIEGHESINEFFDVNGTPEYAYIIYQNLGDLYLDKERFDDAALTYRAFVNQDPYHYRAPEMQAKVIESYRQGGFPTQVLKAKGEYVDRYGMDGPFWNGRERAAHRVVVKNLKANLGDLAQFYHARAQEKSSRDDYQVAARWYRKYLDYFPGEADSANTNFLLAEILYESEDFEAAAEEYERTSYEYPQHERAGEAGYAALLSYQKHEASFADSADKSDWHDLYLDSALRFADTYPQHPQSGPVLTTAAEDLFEQEEFDLAIGVARSVVGKEPAVSNELLDTAWTVIAHSHFDLDQFDEAETAYTSLQNYIPAEEAERREEIRERIASSIYKQGEQARNAGDLRAAVENFLRVGPAVPDSAIRATAEYDAAAALIAMEDWVNAAGVLESFRQDYPDSEYIDDVTQKLAVVYVNSGDQSLAAQEFERIADASGTSPEVQQEALWQAVDLYKSTGEVGRESALLEKIIARHPYPLAESIEARLRLADIAKINGDFGQRGHWLREMISADATAGAERSDRSRFLAAKASLELIEPKREAFAAMRLTIPLKKSLGVKKTLMEDLLAEYGKAAEYGVAEVTTAATHQIGEVYRQFSSDLLESERPADLDAEGLDQYEILLEEQAFPFEEKAIDLYKANTRRAADGVYDEWVQKSFAALAVLLPGRYAKVERGEDVVATLN